MPKSYNSGGSSGGSRNGSRNVGNKNRPPKGGSTMPAGYMDSRPVEADKKQTAK